MAASEKLFLKRMKLLVLASLLLTLSFTNVYTGWIVFFSLIPLYLFWSISENLKNRSYFFYGLFFGAFYFAVLAYWDAYATVLGYLFIIIIEGLFLSLFFAAVGYISKKLKIKPLFLFPFFWFFYEVFSSFGVLGFPWGCSVYRLAYYKICVQTASIFGWQSISLIIILINFLIFKSIAERKHKYSAASVIILVVFCLFNYSILINFEKYLNNIKPEKIKAAVIQPNIKQFLKWDNRFREENFKKSMSLAEASIREDDSVRLVITPESVTASYLRFDIPMKNRVIDLSLKYPRTGFLIGSPDIEYKNDNRHIYNSAFFYINGKLEGKYNKNHLVPGGEFIPFSDKLTFLSSINVGQANFTPGEKTADFELDKIRLGALICYETCFSGLVCRNAEKNNILANISNDAWFKISPQSYQHSAFGIIRAVETRRSVLRSANTGISMIIEPTGKISRELGLYRRGFIAYSVPICSLRTFYMKYPYLMNVFAFLLFVLVLFANFKKKSD